MLQGQQMELNFIMLGNNTPGIDTRTCEPMEEIENCDFGGLDE